MVRNFRPCRESNYTWPVQYATEDFACSPYHYQIQRKMQICLWSCSPIALHFCNGRARTWQPQPCGCSMTTHAENSKMPMGFGGKQRNVHPRMLTESRPLFYEAVTHTRTWTRYLGPCPSGSSNAVTFKILHMSKMQLQLSCPKLKCHLRESGTVFFLTPHVTGCSIEFSEDFRGFALRVFRGLLFFSNSKILFDKSGLREPVRSGFHRAAVPIHLSGIGGPGAPHRFEFLRRSDSGLWWWIGGISNFRLTQRLDFISCRLRSWQHHAIL